ncbi:hypothetical protein, partial, partial [Parasitella parasitica]
MRQSSSSVAANCDPIYYKSVNEDIDIYDGRTYANLLPSSSSVCATEDDDPTNQGSSYDLDDCDDNSENVETTTHGNTALIARAMKYTDYMTPPKDERLELILRVHLLGHVGINAVEKILHNDYYVHWTNMRDNITKVLNDCHACQSHGIFKVGYHPPRS